MKRLASFGLAIVACAHRPAPAAPTSSIVVAAAQTDAGIATNVAPPEEEPFRLARDKRPEPGCFAWSRVAREVLCVTGQHSIHESDDRAELTVLSPDDDKKAVDTVDDVKDEIEKRLGEGAFHVLPRTASVRKKGRTTVGGFVVSLAHDETYAGGDNSAPRYDVKVQVLAPDASLAVDDDLPNVACEEPEVLVADVRDLGIVVERICTIADEGEYGYDAQAWLCDPASGACH